MSMSIGRREIIQKINKAFDQPLTHFEPKPLFSCQLSFKSSRNLCKTPLIFTNVLAVGCYDKRCSQKLLELRQIVARVCFTHAHIYICVYMYVYAV